MSFYVIKSARGRYAVVGEQEIPKRKAFEAIVDRGLTPDMRRVAAGPYEHSHEATLEAMRLEDRAAYKALMLWLFLGATVLVGAVLL